MQDFKKIEEIYQHVEETFVVDLIKHALSLDEEHTAPLIEPDKGLYLPGNFEPTFYEEQTYYAKSGLVYDQTTKGVTVNTAASTPIKNLDMIPKLFEDIYDSKMNMIMPAHDLRRLARHFKRAPTIPAIAVRMAIGTVQKTVSTICRHSCAGYQRYRPDLLVKPEFVELVNNDEYMHAFETLLDEVQAFINKDHWNFYTYRIRGGTLIIQKGLDWRIAEYYRMKFEQEEAEHDGN
jgi:cobalamin biosynthesis Mg chelatase CobN